jgi:hypothetical protein
MVAVVSVVVMEVLVEHSQLHSWKEILVKAARATYCQHAAPACAFGYDDDFTALVGTIQD